MKKLTTKWAFSIALLSSPVLLMAAEPAPKGSIDVDLVYASNYIFRGADVYAGYFSQKGKSFGSYQTPGAFQPSITWNTPVDGLSFNIWGSFAMSGRKDTDTDLILQSAPGSTTDLLAAQNGNLQAAVAASLPAAGSAVNSYTGIANYYKERNGLERLDEIDFTISYGKETSVGAMEMGIINYINPGVLGKNAYGTLTEMYFKWGPSFVPLTLGVYTALDQTLGAYQYWSVSYSKSIEMSKSMSLGFDINGGYQVQDSLQGWKDVTGAISLGFGAFTLAFNASYRPDLRFYDTDSASNLPLWIDGGSNRSDGQVGDPSRTTGPLNSYVNSLITTELQKSNANFTYTPRQKLPRVITWISIGYSASY